MTTLPHQVSRLKYHYQAFCVARMLVFLVIYNLKLFVHVPLHEYVKDIMNKRNKIENFPIAEKNISSCRGVVKGFYIPSVGLNQTLSRQ